MAIFGTNKADKPHGPKSALLCIGLVNDQLDPESDFANMRGYPEFNKKFGVTQQICRVQDQFRQLGQTIVHFKYGFSKGYVELPQDSPLYQDIPKYNALILGTHGTEFYENVAPKEGEPIITKHRLSPFFRTRLEIILTAQKVDHVYICGISSNLSVTSAARSAHDRDYKVTILSDCCLAANEDVHNRAMDNATNIAEVKTFGEAAVELAVKAGQ